MDRTIELLHYNISKIGLSNIKTRNLYFKHLFNYLEFILLARHKSCEGPDYVRDYVSKAEIQSAKECNEACGGYSKFVTKICAGQTIGKICECWCMDESKGECVYRDKYLAKSYSIYQRIDSKLFYLLCIFWLQSGAFMINND